jgi:replicative DNA helicase
MNLSAPVYRLKRQARLLSRKNGEPLHVSLDKVAKEEGFQRWSLLAAHYAKQSPASRILKELSPGDLLLLGARPGHGKTLLALEIIYEAIKSGRQGVFYTLDYNARDVTERLQSLGADPDTMGDAFRLDTSDEISADYITGQLEGTPQGTIVAVDYLQILDQNRDFPAIDRQISTLKSFAQEAGVVMIFISQIDRAFELSEKSLPDISDVRLPNQLDLGHFTKSCFLNGEDAKFAALS